MKRKKDVLFDMDSLNDSLKPIVQRFCDGANAWA